MLPPVAEDNHGCDETPADDEAGGEIWASPSQNRAGPVMDSGHDDREHGDGGELEQETAHMNDNALTAAPREAAYVGREMGFYYRGLADGLEPDRRQARRILGRAVLSTVDTSEDCLALVVIVKTMLGQCLTDEVADADPNLYADFGAMHSLLDKVARRVEEETVEFAGDFDGTIPASH